MAMSEEERALKIAGIVVNVIKIGVLILIFL